MVIKKKKTLAVHYWKLIASFVLALLLMIAIASRYYVVVTDPIVNYYGDVMHLSDLQNIRDSSTEMLYCDSNPPQLFGASMVCYDSEDELHSAITNEISLPSPADFMVNAIYSDN